MLRGALAAAVTPLRDDGAALDEDAFGPYLDFLAAAGLDGILALGTTGEGILLSAAERRRAAELFLDGPLPVIVHCGAQTTAETVALAEHAAASGRAAVAVIAPPYFALDDEALLAHLAAAARAAEPMPFYVYEFKARERLRGPGRGDRAPARAGAEPAGLKVSDTPLDAVRAVPARRPRRLRRRRAALLPARARRGRRGLRARLGVPGARGRARPRRDGGRRAPRSSTGSRSRPPRSTCSASAACRCARTCARPLRTLTDDEKRELDAWLESS